MINNDSIVTAYDEHLTLVEWLQKIEKLLANGGLKSTALNDKGNATFSLTLTFNDDTTITSPDMTLTSVNEALKYKGYANITYDKDNSVRIDEENSLEENTLKQTSAIVLSNSEMSIVDELIKKAIKYGFIIFVLDEANNSYDIMPLVCAKLHNEEIVAVFGASSVNQNEGHGFTIKLNYNTKEYSCEEEEI